MSEGGSFSKALSYSFRAFWFSIVGDETMTLKVFTCGSIYYYASLQLFHSQFAYHVQILGTFCIHTSEVVIPKMNK